MSNYDGKWSDQELTEKANQLLGRAVIDRVIAESGLEVLGRLNAYDSGFEAGVLSSEAGVGRADA